MWIYLWIYTISLQCYSTWNNFDQLNSNSCLSSLIVLKSKFIKDFFSVFGGILHCIHSWWLFRSCVVQKGNPKIWSQIKLIKCWIWGVFIWEGLVVKLGKLHWFQELLLWHKFNLSRFIGNSWFKLVVNNNNLIRVVRKGAYVDSHWHNGWVIVGSTDLFDGGSQDVWEWSWKTGRAFCTNWENLALWSVVHMHHGVFHLTDTGWVNSTAQTFIRSDGNECNGWISNITYHLSLHVLITFEQHIDSVAPEFSTIIKSNQILLHLWSRHHFHCLCDFTNWTDRFHSNLQLLFTDSECSLSHLHQWRWSLNQVKALSWYHLYILYYIIIYLNQICE